jgi:hypothetical protein
MATRSPIPPYGVEVDSPEFARYRGSLKGTDREALEAWLAYQADAASELRAIDDLEARLGAPKASDEQLAHSSDEELRELVLRDLRVQRTILAEAAESRAHAWTSSAQVKRDRKAEATNNRYPSALAWFLNAPQRGDEPTAKMTVRAWCSPSDHLGGAPPCVLVQGGTQEPGLKAAFSAPDGGYIAWKNIRNQFETAIVDIAIADPAHGEVLIEQWIAKIQRGRNAKPGAGVRERLQKLRARRLRSAARGRV